MDITTEKFFAGIPMEPASPYPTVFVDLSPIPDSDSEINLSEKAVRSSSPSSTESTRVLKEDNSQ
jgi:hypothetical protein